MKRLAFILSFVCGVLLLTILAACGGKSEFSDRGRYIYDEAGFLPIESEVSLASYLWQLDSKTDYEIVFVFPKEEMDEESVITWFNDHGVGKKGWDNGAAIFVFPDNSVFVAIGSGNDKVSVAFSKTQGERIFQNFNDDPVLTLLRFVSALGGKVTEADDQEIGGETFFEVLADNLATVLLWASVVVLLLFLIQQFDGFQPRDLILPIGVLFVLGIFFGISAAASISPEDTYVTYGVITSEKPDRHTFTETHVISTGKTTTVIVHTHTRYTNEVTLQSYEFKGYAWRFSSVDSDRAWDHHVGGLYRLSVSQDSERVNGVSGIDDNSGGRTIGDGVWITTR